MSLNYRFLDKAATLTEENYCMKAEMNDPWRLCTVTQVEEVKRVLNKLPICLFTIISSVVFAQMASMLVEQGAAMNISIAYFKIPPASMSMFDIPGAVTFIFIYCRMLVPS